MYLDYKLLFKGNCVYIFTDPATLLLKAVRVYRRSLMNVVRPFNIKRKSCLTTCCNTTDCQW